MDELNVSETKSVLNAKEKTSFFIVNIGNIPIMTLISAYLLIFYTDVVGLNPAAVATLFIITRLFDGINDPLMGYIIDHLPRSKHGKFRPYIVLGSLLCSLNYVLLWLGPSLAPSGKLMIAYLSYFLIGITFDLMDIPLNSLIPVMSGAGKDRDTLSLIKSIGYLSGTILFGLIAIPFILSFPTPQQGYHSFIIITAIFVFVFSSLGAVGVKERIEPLKKEKYKAKDLIEILGARPVSSLFVVNLIGAIGGGAATAAGIYFWMYVVKRPELIGVLAIFAIIGLIVGFFVGNPLLQRTGKKKLRIIGSLISTLPNFIILFIDPSNLLIIFTIAVITGFGGAFVNIVGYGLQADNTDYVEWKQERRAEGAIASLTSFIQKAGLGVGAAIPGYILATTGYVPNVEQTPQAIQGIYWAYILIPAILAIISILVISFTYPITKELNAKIAMELKERRKNALNN